MGIMEWLLRVITDVRAGGPRARGKYRAGDRCIPTPSPRTLCSCGAGSWTHPAGAPSGQLFGHFRVLDANMPQAARL